MDSWKTTDLGVTREKEEATEVEESTARAARMRHRWSSKAAWMRHHGGGDGAGGVDGEGGVDEAPPLSSQIWSLQIRSVDEAPWSSKAARTSELELSLDLDLRFGPQATRTSDLDLRHCSISGTAGPQAPLDLRFAKIWTSGIAGHQIWTSGTAVPQAPLDRRSRPPHQIWRWGRGLGMATRAGDDGWGRGLETMAGNDGWGRWRGRGLRLGTRTGDEGGDDGWELDLRTRSGGRDEGWGWGLGLGTIGFCQE